MGMLEGSRRCGIGAARPTEGSGLRPQQSLSTPVSLGERARAPWQEGRADCVTGPEGEKGSAWVLPSGTTTSLSPGSSCLRGKEHGYVLSQDFMNMN